jgi:hypothetical protein
MLTGVLACELETRERGHHFWSRMQFSDRFPSMKCYKIPNKGMERMETCSGRPNLMVSLYDPTFFTSK